MPKRRMKGDGAIYYDEKRSLYVGQVSLGADENGKRKRKTVYGKNKKEVREKMKNVDYQIFTGTFTDESEITIYHLAAQLLDDLLEQNEIKEVSYARHSETLKILKPIYNTPLQSCNETQIRAFFSTVLDYSQSCLNKVYGILNRTLKEAVRRNIISSNPMEHIKRPKSKQVRLQIRALTKDEQRRLMQVLQQEKPLYYQQMLISVLTGMRMGEINALYISDVNFTFNRIYVHGTITKDRNGAPALNDTTKTNAGTRTLILTPPVAGLLKTCIGDRKEGLIFTYKDKLISTSQVSAEFRRIIKKYEITDTTITNGKINLHSLRHTFGTRCAEAGMPPKVLQEIMGHTDISVTMNTYFYATNDYISDNVNRISSIFEAEGLSLENGSQNAEKNIIGNK